MHIHAEWLAACVLGFMFAAGPAVAQEKKAPPAEVVSPKAGGMVEEFSEVEGRLMQPGWPVVLIKPPGDQPWYVQAPVESISDGSFSVPGRFGDAMTKAGTKFRVIIIVAKDKRAAHQYETGAQLKALPPGSLRSETITVTRGE